MSCSPFRCSTEPASPGASSSRPLARLGFGVGGRGLNNYQSSSGGFPLKGSLKGSLRDFCYYIGASIIPNTILGAPYYNYGIMGSKTLLEVLRPLHWGVGLENVSDVDRPPPRDRPWLAWTQSSKNLPKEWLNDYQ